MELPRHRAKQFSKPFSPVGRDVIERILDWGWVLPSPVSWPLPDGFPPVHAVLRGDKATGEQGCFKFDRLTEHGTTLEVCSLAQDGADALSLEDRVS